MKTSDRIKLYLYQHKENKRYKKFKSCTLPYPFFDEKRLTFEWVTYIKKQYDINRSLLYAIENLARTGVIYHYKQQKIKHCHSFDEVIEALYKYPESFIIPDEFLSEYSNQELLFLKQVQSYLHLIGLRDYTESKKMQDINNRFDYIYDLKHKTIKDKLFMMTYHKKCRKQEYKDNLKRYTNTKVLEYLSYNAINVSEKRVAKSILNGEKDYAIKVKYSFSEPSKNKKSLIICNGTFIGVVENQSEEVIKFKDLKEERVNFKLLGFKSFKEYKNNLKQEFKEESIMYNEKFTEESEIYYIKLKTIETFTNF